MAIDQLYEQNSKVIKGINGAKFMINIQDESGSLGLEWFRKVEQRNANSEEWKDHHKCSEPFQIEFAETFKNENFKWEFQMYPSQTWVDSSLWCWLITS